MFWSSRPCPMFPPAAGSAPPAPAPDSGGYAETLLGACRALRLAEWGEAEALLMRAAPLAGEDPGFWNLVGVCWELRGDPAAARRFYGRAIRADSGHAPAQANMRRLFELHRFGRTREAVALGDERACPSILT